SLILIPLEIGGSIDLSCMADEVGMRYESGNVAEDLQQKKQMNEGYANDVSVMDLMTDVGCEFYNVLVKVLSNGDFYFCLAPIDSSGTSNWYVQQGNDLQGAQYSNE